MAFDPELDAGMRRSLLVMLTRDALSSGSASQEGVQARYRITIQEGVGAVVSIEPR